MFRVDPKTVTRWHRPEDLRDPDLGGHRRFHESEVRRLLGEGDRRRSGARHGAVVTGRLTGGREGVDHTSRIRRALANWSRPYEGS
jgi:hypothetical protein